MLSARPVVPLDAVTESRGQTVFSRPWILGLGLIGALLVGIFATALYYSRSNGDAAEALEGAEVGLAAEGNSAGAANSFSGPVAAQPTVDDDNTSVAKKQTPATNSDSTEPGKKPRPRLVAVIREKNNNHIEEESDSDRKAARRQARKERRRAERERREARSPDDLLRIRDIFEGSPRP